MRNEKFDVVFYDGVLDIRIKNVWVSAVLAKALSKFVLENGQVVGQDVSQMALELVKASAEHTEWADTNKIECDCPTCKMMKQAQEQKEKIMPEPVDPSVGHYV